MASCAIISPAYLMVGALLGFSKGGWGRTPFDILVEAVSQKARQTGSVEGGVQYEGHESSL